jgi:uracil-DNA glycosylase
VIKIYPKKEDVFNAFKVSPINSIKVVIVGQDPYHQPKQAHGLCFSVLKPVPPPPSLKNIYKNLSTNKEISFKMPNHGNLTKWAEQGVFLLNASLTVEDSKPNSHAKCGWQKFTDQVISVINEQCNGVVFLLWGKPAQEKAKSVNPSKHHILKTSHPSPLSASQGFLTSSNIFFYLACFSDCNKYLEKTGRTAINWNVD